jgi:hypothetical protein
MRTILLTLTALLLQGKTLATTYILPTWEQLATTSEFIGVVECVTAGGIVARYRVIDSWKGAAVGSELNISQHVDVFELQFPISLVGERFLVFGEKTASYRISSLTSGGGVPLWWRKIPTDLRCFSPISLKAPFTRYLSSYLGARTSQLTDFKTAVISFLSCGKNEQELRLMLAAARKNLHLPDPTEPSDKGNEEDIKLSDSLQASKNVEELWERIIDNASRLVVPAIPKTAEERRAQSHRFTLLSILSDGGREQCQALLLKTNASKLPWDKRDVDRTLSEIRRSLSPDHAQPSWLRDANANGQKRPTPDEIAKAETLLATPWDYQTGPAFELLCRHAPGSVVPFLLGWEPSKERSDQHFGYRLGSAFGNLCAVDRAKHLKALQSAKDSWIRASAAVYLRFYERKEGEDALRKVAMIEGDPGAWAALVLASRGDKAAMMRALGVMSAPHEGTVLTGNRGNLQKRLRVLLSNAAAASGVPQPPSSPKEYPEWHERLAIQKQWHEALIKWWDQNQDKIILSDPWAKHLDEQKVD